MVTVRAEEDAAAALALMMRETLETPGMTCALVTPDLALGRRVAARLERLKQDQTLLAMLLGQDGQGGKSGFGGAFGPGPETT